MGSVFVSAGEVSGDHYVASVTARLRAKGFSGEIYGLCGGESISSGARGLWRAERLQLLGVTEIFGSIMDIVRLLREMTDEIERTSPDVLLLVDSPDFNMRLAKAARRRGYRGKIVYISPPHVWAWRSGRTKALTRDVDLCLPLFRFEHDYLTSAGCESRWVGHPFVREFADFRPDRETTLAACSDPVASDSEIVALLPGSRSSEIDRLAPILMEVCETVRELGLVPVFSVAPGLSARAAERLQATLSERGITYSTAPGRELMAASRAVVGSSGTATAQALLLRRYMVVIYKVSALSAMIGRMFLRNRFFAVPNLLAGEMFYPELIQERARADLASEALRSWLGQSGEAKAAAEAKMDELAGMMGTAGALDMWSDIVLEAAR